MGLDRPRPQQSRPVGAFRGVVAPSGCDGYSEHIKRQGSRSHGQRQWRTFRGGIDWLREHGIEIIDMGSTECERLLTSFIEQHPDVWYEDIGECRLSTAA